MKNTKTFTIPDETLHQIGFKLLAIIDEVTQEKAKYIPASKSVEQTKNLCEWIINLAELKAKLSDHMNCTHGITDAKGCEETIHNESIEEA